MMKELPSILAKSQSAVVPFDGKEYDDVDGAVAYTGAWSAFTDPDAYDGGFHYTNTSGAKATITFTGMGIGIICETTLSSGIMSVSLDGSPAVNVDQYTPGDAQYQKLITSMYATSYGVHTLVLTVTGTKNPSSGGIGMSLDAFVVYSTNPRSIPMAFTFQPVKHGERWTVNMVTVSNTGGGTPSAKIYRGTMSPSNYVGKPLNGLADAYEFTSAVPSLLAGEILGVGFIDCDPMSVCTVTLTGTQYNQVAG